MKNKIKIPDKKGFSLVELIVVIAIMAVLVAVLAPALLQYVERSRAQKDDSAMGEVTNAIQLALADQNAYDEALKYVLSGKDGNWAYSCYVDKETPNENNKVVTKDKGKTTEQYLYSDAERKADEVTYTLNGRMRGLTITFSPSNIGSSKKKEFVLANGSINSSDSTVLSEINTESDDTTMKGQIYNKLRAAIGDTVPVTSQTYRNSSYTVFIRMGTTGANASEAQDAIKVYGQWGGTNLAETASSTGGSGSTGGNSDSNEGGGSGEAPVVGNSIEVEYFNDDGTQNTDTDAVAEYAQLSGDVSAAKIRLKAPSSSSTPLSLSKIEVQEDCTVLDAVTDITGDNAKYQSANENKDLVIELQSEYLDDLNTGSHDINIVTPQGSASATISIQGENVSVEDATALYYKINDGTMYIRQTSQTGYKLAWFSPSNVYGQDDSWSWNGASTSDVNKIVIEENIYPGSCEGMFFYFSNLTEIENINRLKTTNCVSFTNMFGYCSSLTSIDLSGWDVSNVTEMDDMFGNCTKLTSVSIRGWNARSVLSMNGMFNGCSKLENVNISNVRAPSLRSTEDMFYFCKSLSNLNLSSFTAQNVNNVGGMFAGCSALINIPMNWLCSQRNITDITSLFYKHKGLQSIDISGLHLSTSDTVGIGNAFAECTNLTSVDMSGLGSITVKACTTFSYCDNLTSINLNGTSLNITDASSMFRHCVALPSIDLSNVSTASCKLFTYMFYDCQTLSELDLTSFNTAEAYKASYMFANASNLTSILVSAENWTIQPTPFGDQFTNMFKNCGTKSVTKC